jgi:hypothetical protein
MCAIILKKRDFKAKPKLKKSWIALEFNFY